jgi:hypothetical protein
MFQLTKSTISARQFNDWEGFGFPLSKGQASKEYLA